MKPHAHVKHPKELLRQGAVLARQRSGLLYVNDQILQWITTHVLGSIILFDIALIVPLLVIPAPENVKITLGVISGSWIQWWALPALQRGQLKTQAQNDAKAEADHETLTYLATQQDKQLAELQAIKETLERRN
jgi:hypothetical protein